MKKRKEERQAYFHGYFTALQDIVGLVGEGDVSCIAPLSDELVQKAVADIIKETEIET